MTGCSALYLTNPAGVTREWRRVLLRCEMCLVVARGVGRHSLQLECAGCGVVVFVDNGFIPKWKPPALQRSLRQPAIAHHQINIAIGAAVSLGEIVAAR